MANHPNRAAIRQDGNEVVLRCADPMTGERIERRFETAALAMKALRAAVAAGATYVEAFSNHYGVVTFSGGAGRTING